MSSAKTDQTLVRFINLKKKQTKTPDNNGRILEELWQSGKAYEYLLRMSVNAQSETLKVAMCLYI